MTVADVLCLVVALSALSVLALFLVQSMRAQLPAAQAWQVLAKLHEGQDERVHTALARLTSPAAGPSAKAQVEEMRRKAAEQGFVMPDAAPTRPGPARENPIPPAPEPSYVVDLPVGFVE